MKRTEAEKLRDRYLDGMDDGRHAADRDRRDGYPTDSVADDLRHEAHVSVELVYNEVTRLNAAYDLGYTRGYREEIR